MWRLHMEALKLAFSGLSRQYLIRQLFFSGVICACMMSLLFKHPGDKTIILYATLFIINTLLYPYARFAYEKVIGFLIGNNVFIVNTIVMLGTKLITMYFCWFLAIFIAPAGLLFIYVYRTKNGRF